MGQYSREEGFRGILKKGVRRFREGTPKVWAWMFSGMAANRGYGYSTWIIGSLDNAEL